MSIAVTVYAIQTRKDPAEDRQAGRDADQDQRKPDDGDRSGIDEAAEHPGRRDIRTNQAGSGI